MTMATTNKNGGKSYTAVRYAALRCLLSPRPSLPPRRPAIEYTALRFAAQYCAAPLALATPQPSPTTCCLAARCAERRCNALRCTALRCAALRSSALRCTALHCAALALARVRDCLCGLACDRGRACALVLYQACAVALLRSRPRSRALRGAPSKSFKLRV